MEEEKIKDNNSKVEDRIQKKSEKDRNGVIGGLVFGIFLHFWLIKYILEHLNFQ